jgi:hypothetical protein
MTRGVPYKMSYNVHTARLVAGTVFWRRLQVFFPLMFWNWWHVLSLAAGYPPDGYDQRLHNRGMQAGIPGLRQIPPRDQGKRISFFMFPGPMKRGYPMIYFYVRQHSTLSVSPVTPSGCLLHLRHVFHRNLNIYPSFNWPHVDIAHLSILRDSRKSSAAIL